MTTQCKLFNGKEGHGRECCPLSLHRIGGILTNCICDFKKGISFCVTPDCSDKGVEKRERENKNIFFNHVWTIVDYGYITIHFSY